MSVDAFLDDSGSDSESLGERLAENATRPAECPQAGSSPEGEEPFAGGCLSNTHPPSSQAALEGYPDYHFAGAYDWFEWGCHVQWEDERFQVLNKKLESAKSDCQEKKLPCQVVSFDGIVLVVERTGGNRGGDRGEHYEYKVRYAGLTIGIAARNKPNDQRPNVYVRMTGRECLLLGAVEGYQMARQLIVGLGGKVVKEKLSRVDISLDIAGLDVVELQEAAERKQFITDAGSVRPVNDVLHDIKSGIVAGKRPMRLVIYDKLEELQDTCDELYRRGLIDRRWGGQQPENATRVEYQCSRAWLMNQGISSPDDLFRLVGSLVEKLTGQWFWMTEEPVDRKNKNQSRAVPLAVWRGIQEAFRKVYGKPAGPLVPVQRDKIEPMRLMKQARGCLRNALLQMRKECRDYREFAKKAAQLVYDAGIVSQDAVRFMDEYHRMELDHLT